MKTKLKTESAVKDRYAAGAKTQEAALCCPVDYDPQYLEIIPDEVIERDYGCGDPSKYVNPGETVLDLGSGTGKICFIAAQVVGAEGCVIGAISDNRPGQRPQPTQVLGGRKERSRSFSASVKPMPR